MIAPPLVIRFGALGDMIVLTTLLRTLHARFGSPVDLVLTERHLLPMLAAQPCVGRLYPVSTRKFPYWLNPQLWRLARRLRERGAGPVWICQTDDFTHELAERAGYGPRWWISQRDFPMSVGEHCIDRLLRMGRATPRALSYSAPTWIGAAHSPCDTPRLVVPTEWQHQTQSWLAARGLERRPLVLIQAGNKRTMTFAPRQRRRNRKYWPEASWAAVIDRISALTPEAAILLLGVRLESSLNRAILGHATANAAIDVAGEVPLPILAGLCARALGMVSVDTGPAHVAAAVGCPLVVLFGDQDPRFIAPRAASSPVEIVTGAPHADRPMLAIAPEGVTAAWQRLLHASIVMPVQQRISR